MSLLTISWRSKRLSSKCLKIWNLRASHKGQSQHFGGGKFVDDLGGVWLIYAFKEKPNWEKQMIIFMSCQSGNIEHMFENQDFSLRISCGGLKIVASLPLLR